MLLKTKFMSLLNNATKKSYVVYFQSEGRKFLFTKEILFEIKSNKVENLIEEFFEAEDLNQENIIYKSNNLYSFNSYSTEKLKDLVSIYLESEISNKELETEDLMKEKLKLRKYKDENNNFSVIQIKFVDIFSKKSNPEYKLMTENFKGKFLTKGLFIKDDTVEVYVSPYLL